MLVPYSKLNPRTHLTKAYFFEKVNEGLPYQVDEIGFEKTYLSAFDGFKQSSWKRRIRDKANATTVASGQIHAFEDAIIQCLCTIQSGSQRVERSMYGSMSAICQDGFWLPIDGITPSTETDNSALIGFLKKCKSAQRKLMAGVVAGELRETLNLIRKPASALRTLVSDYVQACRGRSRGLSPKATARLISNQWLEYSFGMRPLISDIGGAMRAAEKRFFDLPSAYVTHTSRTSYSAHSDTIPFSAFGQYIPCLLNRLTYRTYGRKLCGEVRLMTTGNHGPLAETLGLTLPDFIPTVYELIPYSFLVDYFTNIGEVLEAMSFCQADLIWHSDTCFERATRSVSIGPAKPSTLFGAPVVDYKISPGTYVQYFENFNRKSVPLGFPSLGLKVPGDWSKFLNIGALAALRVL